MFNIESKKPTCSILKIVVTSAIDIIISVESLIANVSTKSVLIQMSVEMLLCLTERDD